MDVLWDNTNTNTNAKFCPETKCVQKCRMQLQPCIFSVLPVCPRDKVCQVLQWEPIEHPNAAVRPIGVPPIEHCGRTDEVVAWEVPRVPPLTLLNLLLHARRAIKTLHHTPDSTLCLIYRLTLLLLPSLLKKESFNNEVLSFSSRKQGKVMTIIITDRLPYKPPTLVAAVKIWSGL